MYHQSDGEVSHFTGLKREICSVTERFRAATEDLAFPTVMNTFLCRCGASVVLTPPTYVMTYLLTYLLTYYLELSSDVLISKRLRRNDKLGRYDDADVVLTLPSPLIASNVRWLSVWCEEFAVRSFHSTLLNHATTKRCIHKFPISLYVCFATESWDGTLHSVSPLLLRFFLCLLACRFHWKISTTNHMFLDLSSFISCCLSFLHSAYRADLHLGPCRLQAHMSERLCCKSLHVVVGQFLVLLWSVFVFILVLWVQSFLTSLAKTRGRFQFYLIEFWRFTVQVNFGDVAFPANVQVPRATVIGRFSDETNGVSSGNVTVLDVNTINVKAFTCSCAQSGSFY